MAKKKASFLKPLLFALVSAILLVMFFVPTASVGAEVAGTSIGGKTNFSGLDSMIALFSDKASTDMSAGVAAAYTMKSADATSASFGTAATCWFILAIVSAVTLVLSVLAMFSKKKKVLFGKLFGLAMLVLSLVILISTIAMISQWNGQALVGSVTKAAIHMGSIVAFVFGLAGAGVAFALKK